jgi:hypothetical protein
MKILKVVVSMGVELAWIGELKEVVGVMEMSSDSCLSDAGTLLMKKIAQKEVDLKGGKEGSGMTISGMLLENERFRKREEAERNEREKGKREKEIVMKENEMLKRKLEKLRKESEDERKRFERERNETKQEIGKLKKKQSPPKILRSCLNFLFSFFF